MRAASLSFALLLAACAPAMENAAANGQVELQGTVQVVGSEPVSSYPVLRAEDGTTYTLSGALDPELRRLSGVKVEIRGELQGRNLAATDYDIVSVDGQPVEMGMVERAPAGGLQLRQSDGTVVALSGAASNLRVGQKVWVQGPTTSSVTVQTYGVISQ